MTTTGLSEIGRRLKAHRIGRGQTADEIADKLGISRAAVYRIDQSGDRPDRYRQTGRMAHLLARVSHEPIMLERADTHETNCFVMMRGLRLSVLENVGDVPYFFSRLGCQLSRLFEPLKGWVVRDHSSLRIGTAVSDAHCGPVLMIGIGSMKPSG